LGGVSSVAFDAELARLAIGSHDRTVKLWDPRTGNLFRTIERHMGPIHAVRVAPNGRYLVAAGASLPLQFRDIKSGESFLDLYAFGPGTWLALLPDGRFDGTPEALRYLCYTERGTLNSYTAEELVGEFHDPRAIAEILARYHA
jgi:WD40 repeat protein